MSGVSTTRAESARQATSVRSDRRRDPRDGGAMRRVGRGEHRRTLRRDPRSDERAVLGRDAPAPAVAHEARDARRRRSVTQFFGCMRSTPLMRRVGHLLVRVAVDDQVDARHLARDARRHVLARQPGRHGVVARRLVRARCASSRRTTSAPAARAEPRRCARPERCRRDDDAARAGCRDPRPSSPASSRRRCRPSRPLARRSSTPEGRHRRRVARWRRGSGNFAWLACAARGRARRS